LIVTGALGLMWSGVNIVGNLMIMGVNAPRLNNDPPAILSGGIGVAAGIVGLIVGIVIILGALKMKRLESYAFAMTVAILAMIPCISPCCVLGLPIGIWAVVVLSDGYVKEAFRS
jgi:predicted lysophospholipase L1 biosynthesis ABC-type transport system permease subunit